MRLSQLLNLTPATLDGLIVNVVVSSELTGIDIDFADEQGKLYTMQLRNTPGKNGKATLNVVETTPAMLENVTRAEL